MSKSWISMHGFPCMDIYAWVSMHGYPCMDNHALKSMHEYPCLDIHAWISGIWFWFCSGPVSSDAIRYCRMLLIIGGPHGPQFRFHQFHLVQVPTVRFLISSSFQFLVNVEKQLIDCAPLCAFPISMDSYEIPWIWVPDWNRTRLDQNQTRTRLDRTGREPDQNWTGLDLTGLD